MIKENEVRSYSQTIADNINLEDLTELLNQVTESGDICVHLIGANGEQIQESGKFSLLLSAGDGRNGQSHFVPESPGERRNKNGVF